jgi:hypothetical protein
MRKISIIGALILLPLVTLAQPRPEVFDEYKGESEWNLSMRTIVLDPDERLVAAEIFVGNLDCSGSFVGTGKLNGSVLELTPYKKDEDAASCLITVTFNETGKALTLEENGCSYLHGAQCEFSGALKCSGSVLCR